MIPDESKQKQTRPEPEPDMADEAGPKSTEFGTKKDGEAITSEEWEKVP